MLKTKRGDEMKKIPKIGDIVYSLNVGNAAMYREQKLTQCEVVSVGRKYFEISPIDNDWKWKEKFHIDGWCQVTGFTASHALYETKQEFLDDKEEVELLKKIRDHFGAYGRCSTKLNDLKKIVEILNLQ